MKFLIAFAVIAVSFAAEVKVVHLPHAPAPAYETPDNLPLIAPASIFEVLVPKPIEILKPAEPSVEEPIERVKVAHIPMTLDAVVKAPFEQYQVKVETPVIENIEPLAAPEVLEAVEPVKVVDINIPEVPVYRVKVVDPRTYMPVHADPYLR